MDTAVRFLQNSKVVPTPLDNKRLFLAKKGLTESEIELALKTSGAYNVPSPPEIANNVHQIQSQQNLLPNNNAQMSVLVNSDSLLHKILKWISNFILAGCIAYTAYKLVIKVFERVKFFYVYNYFFKNFKRFFLKSKSKPELNKESLLNENNQLKQTINEMRETLEGLKQSVDNVSNIVRQFHISKVFYFSLSLLNFQKIIFKMLLSH